MRRLIALLLLSACATLAACASMEASTRQRQVASVLTFLFPGKDQPPPPSDQVAVLNVPFRIGVAFVPDQADASFRLSETDRLKLAGQVRDAFAGYPFISARSRRCRRSTSNPAAASRTSTAWQRYCGST
jgi:rhombotail lipoprotein